MEKEWVIYIRTNLENGLQYIGQTDDFERREKQWKNFKHKYANQFIDEDRKNYDFDVEIIARTDTQEKAWELEKRLINMMNTKYPNGYNVDNGGEFGKDRGFIAADFLRTSAPDKPKKEIEETEVVKISQFSKDGKFIKNWNKLLDIEKELGIPCSNIRCCLKGKLQTAGGFKWKRANFFNMQ